MRRPIIIDHVGLLVADLSVSTLFYEAALRALGFTVIERLDEATHFGLESLADLALYQSDDPTKGVYIGFLAPKQEAVRQFFAAALSHGGTERLKPAPRTEYHDDYYAAFVGDPDRNNIEATTDRATPFTPPPSSGSLPRRLVAGPAQGRVGIGGQGSAASTFVGHGRASHGWFGSDEVRSGVVGLAAARLVPGGSGPVGYGMARFHWNSVM